MITGSQRHMGAAFIALQSLRDVWMRTIAVQMLFDINMRLHATISAERNRVTFAQFLFVTIGEFTFCTVAHQKVVQKKCGVTLGGKEWCNTTAA